MQQAPADMSFLASLGLTPATTYRNLPVADLVDHTIRLGTGHLTASGALAVKTGSHTGRSPQDKFVVEDDETRDSVWWGKVNKPFSPEAFNKLCTRVCYYLSGHSLYIQDLAAGADPAYRLPIRVITPSPWHAMFAENMFLRPDTATRNMQAPGFTIIHAPDFMAEPERDGTRSPTFVIIDFTRRIVLIGGTSYAGEIKKSIFTVMNYLLPARGIMPMHCSANMSAHSDVAIFFGLSGTGKTTLSADVNRYLIGDDEHGWGEQGVFNFEGGCYAKAINLSAVAEPQIYAACEHFGTVLENVILRDDGTVDYSDASLTENTRACYPLDFIPNHVPNGMGGQPKHIVMLTADAFGVLPPISKLTPEQAMYHFLSGYTARVAGTEKGVTEPQATFSACFGAPFLPRPPQVYAQLLGELMQRHDVHCWLLNTGWSGGAYGTGQRMKLAVTRMLLGHALAGHLEQCEFVTEPHFGLSMPKAIEGIDPSILNPREAWADKDAYDAMAEKVAGMFAENYRQFDTEKTTGDSITAIAR